MLSKYRSSIPTADIISFNRNFNNSPFFSLKFSEPGYQKLFEISRNSCERFIISLKISTSIDLFLTCDYNPISNANAQIERWRRIDIHTRKGTWLCISKIDIYLSMQFNFLSLKPMSYTINIQLFSSSKGKGRKDWFHPILPLNFLQPSPSSFLIKMRPIKSRINWITSVERGKRDERTRRRSYFLVKRKEKERSVDHGWARTIFPSEKKRKIEEREREIRFLPSVFQRDYDFTRWKLPSPPREVLSRFGYSLARNRPGCHGFTVKSPLCSGFYLAYRIRTYPQVLFPMKRWKEGGIVTFGFLFNEVV